MFGNGAWEISCILLVCDLNGVLEICASAGIGGNRAGMGVITRGGVAAVPCPDIGLRWPLKLAVACKLVKRAIVAI